ncbi:metal-dependent hydrolase [Halorubrum sp. E3]|nr:metal-dependent hydrolase [Halorubrum sp. E3]
MHRPGHYGGSLLAYAPVGFLVVAAGAVELAIAGGAVAVAGAMIPDWDQRVPFVRHRGPTHTVWFALLVGAVLGAAGALVGSGGGVGGAVILGAFGFVVGVTIVAGHLLADVLTPMGIRPFDPLRDDKYTLDVAKAANPVANYALLGLGIVASVVAFLAGGAVAGVLGV